MPTSPNWHKNKKKPVRTPIIRLHGAPTLEPSKIKKENCNKFLHIPQTTIDSPPRNRRRSLSLSSAGRRSPIDSHYLSLTDVRKEKSVRKDRKNEFVSSASKRESSRKILKTADGIRNLELSPKSKKKIQENDDFKHNTMVNKTNTTEEYNETTNDVDKKRRMFREQKTAEQTSIVNHDFDNGSVSSDEFSLKAFPPSLSTDSIDTSPILITYSL